ncbi:MAG: CDP-alcohol phosphatidyltransferase family protein [Treponema sp.]|jgi:phosphatidylglycerophosphate synthase|nr:CDP-alcohol phosphatidyltransferase family protein [Treponema sp.]
MYTIKDIVNSLPEEKKRADGLWGKVLRPLAVPFTWLALKMRLKANTVSYLSAVFSVSGGVLFSMPGFWLPLWGAILLNVFSIFDCVDGSVARVTNTAGPWGNWADAVMGFIAYIAVFTASGVYVFLRTGCWWVLLITSLTSSANLLTRAAFQFYKNIVGTEEARGSVSFEQKAADTVGITGFMMPLLVVFHCIGVLSGGGGGIIGMIALIVFNALFYGGGCLVTLIKLARKSIT